MLHQRKNEIAEALADASEDSKEIMNELRQQLEESRKKTALENLGGNIEENEKKWGSIVGTITSNGIDTTVTYLQHMNEEGELNLEEKSEGKEFLDYLEQGTNFLDALTKTYGDKIFGSQIKTGDEVTDYQLNQMYDLLEKQLLDESLYKSKQRYNQFKNVLNKVRSAIEMHRKIDEAVANDAISEEKAEILKGATWFGKVVSFVCNFLPIGGSEADTNTEKIFDGAIHLGTMEAVWLKWYDVCGLNEDSPECRYMEKVMEYAPECIRHGWDSDICKKHKSYAGH